MVDSNGGYGCFASVWSFTEAPRTSEPPSGTQDISEVSVIPEMKEQEVRSGKEKKSGRHRRRRVQGRKIKRRRSKIAPLRITFDSRTDVEPFLKGPWPMTFNLNTFLLARNYVSLIPSLLINCLVMRYTFEKRKKRKEEEHPKMI